MQDHERITVKWSGAHVTNGRSLNPYGESGLPQEYPVVLMECRGLDPKNFAGGAVPSGREAVSPRTCWTNTYFQRTNSASPGQGIWEQDAANGDSTEHIQGIDAGDVPATCNVNANFDYSITPFLAERRHALPGCSSQDMPPEATVNAVSIPNEVAAFTNPDGDRHLPVRGADVAGEPVAGLLGHGALHARGHSDRRHQLRQPGPRRALQPDR